MAAKEAETKKAADTAEKVKEEKTKATEAKFLVEKLRENSMKLLVLQRVHSMERFTVTQNKK